MIFKRYILIACLANIVVTTIIRTVTILMPIKNSSEFFGIFFAFGIPLVSTIGLYILYRIIIVVEYPTSFAEPVDYENEDVNHACAAVKLNKQILVDPAYRKFDIKHKKFKILSDQEAVPHFKAMRGSN